MSVRFLMLMAAVAVAGSLRLGAARGEERFEAGAFNALDEKGRVEYVLKKMDDRQEALRNISYKMEWRSGLAGGGAREISVAKSVEFRRLDERMWMYMVDGTHRRGDATEQIRWRDRRTFAVEGVVKVLDSTLSKPTARIGMEGYDFRDFNGWTYNVILGVRFGEAGYYGPLVNWVRQWGQDEVTVARVEKGSGEIAMTISHDGRVRTIYFDTARGYMISRMESGVSRVSVEKAEDLCGIWMPRDMKIVNMNDDLNAPHWEDDFALTAFSAGTVTAQEVELDFPAGTSVTHDIYKIHYDKEPDGAVRLLTFRDERGATHAAPFFNRVTTVDAQAAKLYSVTPPGVEPINERSKVAGYAAIALVGGAMVWYQMRRTRV